MHKIMVEIGRSKYATEQNYVKSNGKPCQNTI
jgi:hypothetical protein